MKEVANYSSFLKKNSHNTKKPHLKHLFKRNCMNERERFNFLIEGNEVL